MQRISGEAFLALKAQDPEVQILDVRTPAEFRSCRIEGNVINIPLDRISADSVGRQIKYASRPLYIMCRTQNRALMAAEKLLAEGLTNLVVVEGGVNACQAAGLTLLGEGGVMDIERQVRLIAGLLVLAGFILGFYVAPAFHILSGLIGLGLVFAGASGWCGMAILLAKAPWNRG